MQEHFLTVLPSVVKQPATAAQTPKLSASGEFQQIQLRLRIPIPESVFVLKVMPRRRMRIPILHYMSLMESLSSEDRLQALQTITLQEIIFLSLMKMIITDWAIKGLRES